MKLGPVEWRIPLLFTQLVICHWVRELLQVRCAGLMSVCSRSVPNYNLRSLEGRVFLATAVEANVLARFAGFSAITRTIRRQ